MTEEDVIRELKFWARYSAAPPEPVIRVYAETLARCFTANPLYPLGLDISES